ncbi:hypothetical protein [Microlunatus endophyticus]|nr:hypothetical protein [Microlunatus endophyticus]
MDAGTRPPWLRRAIRRRRIGWQQLVDLLGAGGIFVRALKI